MSDKKPVIIKVTRKFNAPAEQVFDAWLDPAKARQFLFATPTGEMIRAEVDARVGGKFNFTDRRGGEDIAHAGEYLEIDRPRRLVFTFMVEKYSSTPAHVVIKVVPLTDGCGLTLTQQMPAEFAEWAERSAQGWTMILNGLAKVMGVA